MKFKHLFKKSSAISQSNYPQRFYLKNWLASLVIVLLCFSCSTPQVQKPKVAIVVWDGHAKEGQNVGTFRLYQLGEVTPGLKVTVKCEGIAGEGLDYRSLGLGTVQEINRYKDIHIRPIDDGLTEGTEEVSIRIVESEEYEIDKQYIQASFDILDSAFPDIEFEMPASVNEEATESAEVKIKLSRPYEKAIELDYGVQGVLAEEGDDFKFSSNKLVIPAGKEEAVIKFQVTNDAVAEDDETVVIRMVSAKNANIATTESHYYTIKNDDGEPERSVVYDRIYGTLLAFRAGCAMGAITEYNCSQDRIQEMFGFQDKFIPYKHYSGA